MMNEMEKIFLPLLNEVEDRSAAFEIYLAHIELWSTLAIFSVSLLVVNANFTTNPNYLQSITIGHVGIFIEYTKGLVLHLSANQTRYIIKYEYVIKNYELFSLIFFFE